MLATILLVIQAAAAPELVAPGVLNTDADEYGPTLTADGTTMYFTLRADRRGAENIVVSRFDGKAWGKPVPVSFSGQGMDKEPYLAPDGSRLYFASRRSYPGKVPVEGEEGYDLFVVERRGNAWGTPEPLSLVSSDAYDNYPAAADNALYFASHRRGGKGGNDLWVSRRTANGWQPAEAIAELNTPRTDADPYIAPDERYIIICADRPGGAGQGDLYISFRREGKWTEPVSLGAAVNTSDYEYTPWVTSDGKWLYFSRGWGEIWRIETAKVPALRDISPSAPRR